MQEKSKTEIISENLMRAFMQFRRLRFDENAEKINTDHLLNELKHSEVMVLFQLKEVEKDYPNGISVSDISTCLNVKPPSITPIISSLEQKNLLERNMDINDRRIIRVKLKDEGHKFIDEKKQQLVLRIRGLVEYLGEEKCENLTDLINETFTFITSQLHKNINTL